MVALAGTFGRDDGMKVRVTGDGWQAMGVRWMHEGATTRGWGYRPPEKGTAEKPTDRQRLHSLSLSPTPGVLVTRLVSCLEFIIKIVQEYELE